MSKVKIYTDLCDKNGNPIFVGDYLRMTVQPFGYTNVGQVVLVNGGIFLCYDSYGIRIHPLYLVYDDFQDMSATIRVHNTYEIITYNQYLKELKK